MNKEIGSQCENTVIPTNTAARQGRRMAQRSAKAAAITRPARRAGYG
jgi:ribosomal protein S20